MKTIASRRPIEKPSSQLGVGCLAISPQEKRYVRQVLDNNRLSYGPFSRKFEAQFARVHGCKYALMCNSGTSALRAAVACLKELEGWDAETEILVPAVTFVATSNVVIQNGLKPVFVDVHPTHYNIDPGKIEEKITPKTRAIIIAHLFGLPCDMDPILAIVRKHHLKMIEDSCETMFVRYRNKPVGSWGDIACFSTYVAHLIVTGVGGLAMTNNPDYAVVMRSLMNHGRDSIYLSIDDDQTNDPRRLSRVVQNRFKFVRLGYSFRATEMEAALGLGQLERKDQILAARQRNASYLIRHLKPLEKFLQLPSWPSHSEHAFMMFPIVARKPEDKEKLVFFLEQNNIETRDMLPLINQPIYKKLFGDLEPQYPVATRINRQGFYIGCHQALKVRDLEYIVRKFGEFFLT
jgi:perosamine synthetase